MGTKNGGNILQLTDTMGYLAHTPSLVPHDRLTRLNLVAEFVARDLESAGEPTHEGEYVQALRMRTWLACLPSLRTTAAGLSHTAEISEEVLESLVLTLKEAVTGSTKTIREFRGGSTIHGQIAEMAVLSTLLWSHANNPKHAGRSVLPASHDQDISQSCGPASGFDLVLNMQGVFARLQVKSSDKEFMAQQRKGYYGRLYRRGIAIVYASRLIGREEDPNYAPQILADAIISEDEGLLTRANEGIDMAIKKAWPLIRNPAALYPR
jgi:hypothetical protein